MLGLDQTALLLDALRPPPGMEIDVAVGTTFTLDLAALLAVPVAASFTAESEESADLLETIRRYADRTVLFCQAGAIAVPPDYRAALTFVEQTVVEVAKPQGGLFHPKTWLVRFTSGRGRVRHRILVMSRNLTFDRALDVIVRLDEDPECESTINPAPYSDFLERVVQQAVRPLEVRQQELLTSVLQTVRSVRFAVPAPFTEGAFVPMRPGRRALPFLERCDHALAISPFLTSRATADFLGTASAWSGVVSRGGTLDGVAGALAGVNDVKRIKDTVLDAQASVDHVFEPTDDQVSIGPRADEGPAMRGVHAKVFVQDVDESSTVWLGSANLTDPAFTVNWELLVCLTGPRRLVGYDAVLSPKPEQGNLSSLVEDHELTDGDDAATEEAPKLLGLGYELASADVTVHLTRGEEHVSAELRVDPWDPPPDITVRARLLSQQDLVPVEAGRAAWDALALHQVTPFIVLELRGGGEMHRVLVRAQLVGDDAEERRGAVIASAIGNREDFLRYLAALLGLGPLGGGEAERDGSKAFVGQAQDGDRVLEDLLATASRHPRRLASLEQTLRRLTDDPRFAEIVPRDFEELWAAVHEAREAAVR